VDDDLLEPKPPVGITRGLIRQRDKMHVGSIFLNRDVDYEFEDPPTGQRHVSPIPRDIVWVVIRARGEEICRLRIPTAELMGDTPYVPPAATIGKAAVEDVTVSIFRRAPGHVPPQKVTGAETLASGPVLSVS